MKRENFQTEINGKPVDIFTLKNINGLETTITNFGGIVVSLLVPDKNGQLADVVLGYDSLEKYKAGQAYFGATVGRMANRLAEGKFTLEGKTYQLAINNGPNHIHGGNIGLSGVVWTAALLDTEEGPALQLTYLSPDGEEGYPGNLSLKVVYTLTDADELKIDYIARSDQTTVLNLTHHSYFNLGGVGGSDILNHLMEINADAITPVNENLIPTGEIQLIRGSALDFLKSRQIGGRIDNPDEQLQIAGGYDHNYVLNKTADELSFAARVNDPESGRTMEVYTTEPGMQFYSGNFLDGNDLGKDGVSYQRRSAFCLEAQRYPDGPNQPNFPSTLLKAGEVYKQTTIYKFLTPE